MADRIGVAETQKRLVRQYSVRVSERTVRRMCKSGQVDAVRVTPRSPWKIDPDSLKSALEKR